MSALSRLLLHRVASLPSSVPAAPSLSFLINHFLFLRLGEKENNVRKSDILAIMLLKILSLNYFFYSLIRNDGRGKAVENAVEGLLQLIVILVEGALWP